MNRHLAQGTRMPDAGLEATDAYLHYRLIMAEPQATPWPTCMRSASTKFARTKDLKSKLLITNQASSTIGCSKATKPNKLKSSNPCRSIQPHFISTMAERQKMEPDKFAPEGDEDEQEMRIKLLIFRSKNKKLLEMGSFLPLHTYLGSCQTTSFGKKKLETLGDAQSIM